MRKTATKSLAHKKSRAHYADAEIPKSSHKQFLQSRNNYHEDLTARSNQYNFDVDLLDAIFDGAVG